MPAWNSGTDSVKDQLADEPSVADAIARYRPYKTPPEDWDRIAEFVRACAIDMDPPDVLRAREWMRTIIPFVSWCQQDGFGLDREVLFTPDNIDRYIEHGAGEYTDGSRATRRSGLRRMARQLTRTAPWAPPPERIPCQLRHAPYVDAEVDGFCSLTQSTLLLQRRLQATLAIGLGAGLWAREYYTARTDDLIVEDGISWLQVHGSKARRVPVRQRHAEMLHQIAHDDPGSVFFGCAMNQTDKSRLWHLLRDVEIPDWLPRLQTERLRSTWLVHQIHRRVPIPDLLEAAGLATTRPITLLLPYLRPSPPGLAASVMADHHD